MWGVKFFGIALPACAAYVQGNNMLKIKQDRPLLKSTVEVALIYFRYGMQDYFSPSGM